VGDSVDRQTSLNAACLEAEVPAVAGPAVALQARAKGQFGGRESCNRGALPKTEALHADHRLALLEALRDLDADLRDL
jgi:hypothetical protein